MELQWNKRPCTYIKTHFRQLQSQEQTHELRIPEDLPDIGKVLCAWGQPVLRSKEWRGDAMVVSGGVNASVAYLPENGGQTTVMETWIPFQAKWNIPQTNREGTIRTQCVLRGLDARILSVRKMMLRANLAVLGETLEQAEETLYTPTELPQGVEVLINLYPAVLPKEAGEKQFYIEEELHIPDAVRWISFSVVPEIMEQNVVGSRGVIRGNGQLHYVYLDEEGNVKSGNQQIPFAQFIELDHDYDKQATVDSMLMLSSLEHETIPDGVKIQCGVSAQYLVWNQELLDVTEDAYSNLCDLSLQQETLTLPMQLDARQETVDMTVELPEGKMVDLVFRPDFSVTYREGDLVNIEIPGSFQYVYLDDEGNLQSLVQNTVGTLECQAADGCQFLSSVQSIEVEQHAARINLKVQVYVNQELPMVCGVTLGQAHQQDGNQPTLILRRMDTDSLWQLAKETGSTMDAIRKANQLTQDPSRGEMLLIPIN
jgi:hypothetical protein